MFKRQQRLRNQLSSRKIAEAKEVSRIKKKNSVLKAIDENDIKTIKKSALKINDMMEWDDEGADGIVAQEDDEYQFAGIENPKVMVTSSRDPSSSLKEFTKEVYHLIPNACRVNRGNTTLDILLERCLKEQVTDLIIVEETRGVPTSLIISHLPHGPTAKFTLTNVTPRHKMDLDTIKEDGTKGHHKMPTQFPKVAFKGLTSRLGIRLQAVIGNLFPIAKQDSSRIVAFLEKDDVISFHHFTSKLEKNSEGRKEIVLQSHGPYFDMKLYKLFRGTIKDENLSIKEFELRPYMNTANKRRFLSDPESTAVSS